MADKQIATYVLPQYRDALEGRRLEVRRHRAEIMRSAVLVGLGRIEENANIHSWPPVPEEPENGDGTVEPKIQVTCNLNLVNIRKLDEFSRKRGWKRSRLINAIIVDAVEQRWINDID